jgi:hypothetical protein
MQSVTERLACLNRWRICQPEGILLNLVAVKASTRSVQSTQVLYSLVNKCTAICVALLR